MSVRLKSLSCHRALVLDTIYFSRFVPTFPVEQTFQLAEVAAIRAKTSRRISWTACFVKAYAAVAASRPVLRQAFIPWPWGYAAQYDESVAAVAINRDCGGEDRLCFGRIQSPEKRSLLEIQAELDRYQTEPVEHVFRRQIRYSRLPGWLRRIAWRIGLYIDVAKRAKRFGTFSVSSLAGHGTLNRFHPTIHTTSLTYGPLDPAGNSLVTLICDHRLIDGVAAARALASLQEVLSTEIADELRTLGPLRVAA
jgi:hypothetical protein